MTNAYQYLEKAGGLEEEKSYPYTGKRGHCKFDPKKIAVKVVNFTNIPLDEDQITARLVQHGPLSGDLSKMFFLCESSRPFNDCFFVEHSGNKCGVHADIYRRSVVSAYMQQEKD